MAAAADKERNSPHARLLFVRAQPGEHPGSQTSSDTLAVRERDQASGEYKEKHVDFGKLDNIERELADLRRLGDENLIDLSCLDLSEKRGSEPSSKTFQEYMAGKRFDVIHFAGHALTTRDNLTLLVLPGERPGEGEKMMAVTFAELVSGAGARLVYLSSCRGSSANAVASFAQRDVPCVLGFRWDVEDDRAADFAALFYRGLFKDKQTICEAFRAACHGVYKPPPDMEHSPIWVSPILVSQSENWSTQRVL
jgi:CHAT domain-containing protein